MGLKTIFKTLSFSIASVLLMAGCNGAADGTSPDPDNPSNYTLSLSYYSVVDGECDSATSERVFDANERFCAVANVQQDGSALSGVLVDFSSDNATIAPSTTLTNDDGLAKAIVSSGDQTAIAGTLTAIYAPANADSVSDERTYEFTESITLPPVESFTITTSIEDATGTVTRFKVDETVQLLAKFVDSSNQGVADQLITFQAGSATLTPATSLTNNEGIASVSYTPQESELGATTLVASATYQGETISGTSFYEVLSADAIEPEGTLKIGHFDAQGAFVEGQLATGLIPDANGDYIISAGGTFGVSATIVLQDTDGTNQILTTPTSVSFSSACSTDGLASLDSPVTTLSGTAGSTFTDIQCSGNSQRDETITATAVVGSTTLNAELAFSLHPQTLSNISFVSAEPTQIRIKGAGGTGSSESSLVTFLVSGNNGQPIAQQTVDFSLDTTVGGLGFDNGTSTAQGTTNAQGVVTARVQSGTVPTPVRVVATVTDGTTSISTQSEQLTVNTGLPQQLGFSISTTEFNPEAGDHNGEQVTISVFASDSFGNPAPDDTTVNFTTEGGQIQPSCSTENGRCSVEWTSASPRVPDHRITILAYALGHETFFDTNGNNIFDDADGDAIAEACLDNTNQAIACTGNGMDIETYHANGFSDLGDAFRDDDETGVRKDGEPFFNTTGSGYSSPDGLFNGPQCEGALCGTGQANKTYIRTALVLTMSGSDAVFGLSQDGNLIADPATDIVDIPAASASVFTVQLTDSANQMLPNGSTVNVTATEGTLTFNGYTVPNRTRHGGSSTGFTLANDADPGVSTVTVEVTTPKGIESSYSFSVTLL
ncbi:Ig-like domain-containing protein [Shewanella maritima]|uniref:Ig-like domain-containing protein n=1 Tax=Shewanella maritima TaxID=2520507 RepID=UPI003736069A